MKLNAPLFPIAICLMAGIGFGKNLESWTIVMVVLLPLLLVTALVGKWPRIQTASILGCVVLFGMMLGKGNPNRDDGRWMPEVVYQKIHRAKLNALDLREKLLKEETRWNVDEEAQGVIAAMTLGDKSLLDKDVKNTYRKVGVAHILALSGLHLTIIYAVITMTLGWWRSLMLKQVITILSIWAFAFMVGLSPSVVRSSVMISIYALLSLGYREIPLHVLQRHRWLRFWWGLTTVSVSAQVGTAPLVAYYFGTFSTYFLLSNYIVVPLASAILYLTLACLMTSWWIGLQAWLVALLGCIVGTMNWILEVIGALPKSCVEGINLSTLQLYLIYILIGSLVVLLSLWINSKYVKQLTEV